MYLPHWGLTVLLNRLHLEGNPLPIARNISGRKDVQRYIAELTAQRLAEELRAKAYARCRAAAFAVIAARRGRQVDRHVLSMMGRMVWETRESLEWQMEVDKKK